MRNGIVKKRFKKPKEGNYDREKSDISALCYWGETPGENAPPKNLLITASWDRSMCLYDDNDVDDREGTLRDKQDQKHKDSINFVDFRVEHELIATCDDDGMINLYNYHSRRYDGYLAPVANNRPEVKICKFLKGHDVLVSADLDGFLNFYAVYPSSLKT